MTDKSPIDLDHALDALGSRMRSLAPAVTDRLRARVLSDAAEVSHQLQAWRSAPSRDDATRKRAAAKPVASRGWLFGFVDAWSGAAVVALVLCLVAGIGVGYEAGAELMAEAGFTETSVASAARDGDGLFIPEDVL